jgi:NadR type nicotinamide-nucleotide adenylyltransferase
MKKITGMVLGKFMPPHLGHLYLADFARSFVDDLTVVVGSLAREPIPGALRHAWMSELLPDVRVVHLTDENPQDPSEHEDFWNIWKASLVRVLPSRPDYVFASEAYGAKLADVLGSTFVPVDISRSAIPVSATAIRQDPLRHWDYLPRCVRPYFAKRVCIFGPESTGKSTLTMRLADHFRATPVPEFARAWLESRPGPVVKSDIPVIARGQIALEDALARNANRMLICDTDVVSTTIWSEALFGECDLWIRDQADRRDYDLYLLMDVDVPWVADSVRYLPAERVSFFDRCEAELRRRGRRYEVIRGSWEDRFTRAVTVIERILRSDQEGSAAT